MSTKNTVAHIHMRQIDRGPSGSDAFDFPAAQLQTGLKALLDGVVESRAFVANERRCVVFIFCHFVFVFTFLFGCGAILPSPRAAPTTDPQKALGMFGGTRKLSSKPNPFSQALLSEQTKVITSGFRRNSKTLSVFLKIEKLPPDTRLIVR